MLRFVRLSACTVILLLSAWMTAGAQPTATAILRPDRIEAGDTSSLWVFVSGVGPQPGEVDFVSWASLIPSANILTRKSEWRRSGAQWVSRYTLILFDSATLELPPLAINLSAGTPLNTNPLKLRVLPVAGDAEIENMEAVRDISREPESWTDYLPWGAGALLLLLLTIWMIRRVNRRPKQVPIAEPISPQPLVSPYEHALKLLDDLKRRKPWKHGEAKEYYAELSLILREYLENRYRIPAQESTTAEVSGMLQSAGFPNQLVAVAIELLSRTDLVKYAKSTPAESIHEKSLEDARILIVKSHNIKENTPDN